MIVMWLEEFKDSNEVEVQEKLELRKQILPELTQSCIMVHLCKSFFFFFSVELHLGFFSFSSCQYNWIYFLKIFKYSKISV